MIRYQYLITDEEEMILKHDLLDVKDWIDKAIQGKINNCLKRAVKQYQDILIKENATTIPVNELQAFGDFSKRPDYEDRVTRDKNEQSRIQNQR